MTKEQDAATATAISIVAKIVFWNLLMPTLQEWIDGVDIAGNKLDPAKVEVYRRTANRRQRKSERHRNAPTTVVDHNKKCRGLGDVVAAVTHATGIDRAVKLMKPGGCGCEKRQEKLNQLFPFG